MFSFFKKRGEAPLCMECDNRKPLVEFDRTWTYEGRLYGYCLRCNGKAFTETEQAARRDSQRQAQREKREREKERRAALSPEEKAKEDAERKARNQKKAAERAEHKRRRLDALAELNSEREAEGLPPITEKDITI